MAHSASDGRVKGEIASTSGQSSSRELKQPSTDLSITTCQELDQYRNKDGTINFDFFYENPQQGTLRLECSIIRHMLGQIKVGMDLSKITLPTFILERRSLLEMYADHFSHAQLFSAISDGQTTRERMIRTLKWYLSSFHAGRDYTVAKKPYNPILGESFMCYYDLEQNANDRPVEDGPVPWAKPGSVAFYAEQVSHHPPVSAFYAENVKKRVMCNAHIWTKSRFTGLSIGVINAGRAVISLLDHSEQYIFTFPAAYAKGILSVPYVELSGTVTMICPQTGYKAEVEFLMKSLFNSKPNRLSCKLFTPGVANPTDIIEGEWTGILMYKKLQNKTVNEVFLNVNESPLSKKIVRPLKDQGQKESRFLWRLVTAALFVDQVDLATKYKTELENMQRDEERIRKQNNITHEPARFKRVAKDDEDSPWWYYPSLVDRLQNVKRK